VILNSRAGPGRANVDAEVRELFRAAGHTVDIASPAPGAGLAEAAREAARRAAIVVAAGGDGTISSVVAAILDSPAVLGVLPLGSRNHFARDLGLPLELRDAVSVIASGRIGQVDVGWLNDRPFVNNASIGVYPRIVEARDELRTEHRKWSAMAIAAWRVLKDYPGMTVAIEAGGTVRNRRTPFVVVGNNAYSLDGLDMGGRARLDEGKLYAYLTPRRRARDLPMLIAKGMIGRAGRSGAFEIVAATDLTISTRRAEPVRVALDGEVAMLNQPLRYRSCPGALRVILPKP
jgi:diacylglycerol kinase family enzyme